MEEKGSATPTSVRWRIAAAIAAFALCSYLTRSNISVAAATMIPALRITHIQMGQIFSGFLWGYAIFQVPAGMLGDRFGPRCVLAVSAVVWSVSSILTGLAPRLAFGSATASFGVLWLSRFVLGLAQATTFPVGNRVIRNWFRPAERGTGGAIMFMGTSVASATVGLMLPVLVSRYGWQRTFYFTALPPLLLAALWYVWARDTPAQHRGVNQAEAALIDAGEPSKAADPNEVPWRTVLQNRNIILLTCSYVSEGYVLFIFVFWLYIYLVEERHFTAVGGGWGAALPWLVALLLTPLGGRACDAVARRKGRLAGSRVVLATSYGVTGFTLLYAAYAHSAWLAVAALSFSIGFLMASETGFWSAAAHLAGEQVGAVSGIMNTAGILGGILSTSLVPVLVKHAGWTAALGSGTAFAFSCVVFWMFIREPAAADSSAVEVPGKETAHGRV